MTVTGTTLGSVHYFSPEQARGDEVTGASDVYALAIVLFEMLTGRRPFEGDSAAAVALKRLTEDAPTPTAIGHPLPAGLEAILMRALSRDPAERFPDAGAFAEALRVWRRDPDAAAPLAAGAAGAAVATTPPGGEPTVYVPPRVTRPADRVPVAPPPRRIDPYPTDVDDGQPWWIWLLALPGRRPARRHRLPGGAAASAGSEIRPPRRRRPRALVTVPELRGRAADDRAFPAHRARARGRRATRRSRRPSRRTTSSAVSPAERPGGRRGQHGRSSSCRAARSWSPSRSLSGQTLEQAQATLRDVDLRTGEIRREPHPNIPNGSVITQRSAARHRRAARHADRPHRQHRPDAVADAEPDAGADADARLRLPTPRQPTPPPPPAPSPSTFAAPRESWTTPGARMATSPTPRLGGKLVQP